MGDRLGRVVATILMAVAVFEHGWLLYYATTAHIDQRQTPYPTDMPFGYLIAFVLYLAVTSSVVSAWFLFIHSKQTVAALHERMVWVSGAMVIAPWTAVLLSFPGWLLGPIGWLIAPLIGAAAPYALVASSLRLSDSRP
jgi:hypothetical protein